MDVEQSTGYPAIEDFGIIGDMHTCALVSKAGSIDFMCWPVFDSPSVFCRILDKDKGGYFSISPKPEVKALSKQVYLPYTNMLETRWIYQEGVANLLDYFPVSNEKHRHTYQMQGQGDTNVLSGQCPCRDAPEGSSKDPIRHSGVVRKIACARGSMELVVELFPAFNYARDSHKIIGKLQDHNGDGPSTQSVVFDSPMEKLHVDIHLDSSDGETYGYPEIRFETQDKPGLQGQGVVAYVNVSQEQSVTFILHSEETSIPKSDPQAHIDELERATSQFWTEWTRQCSFDGHYREQVERSMLVLKLLTYQPTGAIVASPTFSLPESVGGSRNWDYRYSWIRDTMFALYVFLENGYSAEAERYMTFIFENIIPRVVERIGSGVKEQILPILLTIRGELDAPEVELDHLEGYRGSKPVRIGNGATSHTQLDTFGALLDSIYLYSKFAGPISYDQWVSTRRIVNHVLALRHEPDMSIWEVRGEKQNFVFSKIMIWVAVDRALRLSDKRSNLPCPERAKWLSARDELYEEIMDKGYNHDGGFFCMSYENRDVVDASLLIAPLVLFITPDDPRFLSTLNKIMQRPKDGGLMSAKMIFRYDHEKVHDGLSGGEGAFVMVNFWLIEAMSRASRAKRHPKEYPHLLELRKTSLNLFEKLLSFSNHLGIFSEEIAISGEQIGNFPQAFSHLACVSAAMNLVVE